MKKILYAASECTPFIKTGGLGAVVGSLPKVLCGEDYDVRIVLPLYACIDDKWKQQMEKIISFPVHLGWRTQTAELYTLQYEGVTCYFIGNSFYFCGDSPYADVWLDIEKFSFFDRAVLEMISYLEFHPDIIHCHDWQTGLIPVFLRNFYGHDPYYNQIRTVMTIHNLKFQGATDMGHMMDVTGLPKELFTYDKLESYGGGNMLKGGLTYADKITTVSRTYADEIQRPEYGEGLHALLAHRSRDLCGIVNGIDTELYNPAEDPYVIYQYNERNYRGSKKKNKQELQKKMHLPVDKDIFAVAIISRLTEQKGLDILLAVMDALMEKRIQLYILGGGEKRYEDALLALQEKYPDKLSVQIEYEDALAKMMYAGCDAVLMPSLFEPCGLCQLMAFRYGTVPIVRLTGGLVDTVQPFDAEKQTGTGFGFEAYDGRALLHTMEEAMDLFYEDRNTWNALAKRCMKENYSWNSQAEEYKRLYEKM